MLDAILKEFGLDNEALSAIQLNQGLINSTWKIGSSEQAYILQKINHSIFNRPEDIAHNIEIISAYLKKHYPGYLFVSPLQTAEQKSLLYKEGDGYYRAFPFVAGSHSKDVVKTPAQAYEAAKQFGRFTKLLAGLDVSSIKITIPSFHDLGLRYDQFLAALKDGNKERIEQSAEMISQLKQWSFVKDQFEEIKNNPAFKLRVTHNDTKISNVLFDEADKGLCVIDLDTVMPGYFISDLGDMIRTYVCPVSEEEADFSKIEIRDEFYKAVVLGYYEEMKDVLTETEKDHFFFAGPFLIYMQALRFITDHLNNDVYYGAKYAGQNFVRAGNQVKLLQRLFEKKSVLENLIKEEK